MPSGVFAAYYPFDTLDVVSKLSHSEKLSAYEQRLKQASANMAFAASNMRLTHWIGFFAVPEYYFLKRYEVVGREVEIELYSESEMNDLIGRLSTLSDQYNRVVLLPGTISWRRPLARPETITRAGKQVEVKYEGFSVAPAFLRGDQLASYEKRMNDGNIDRCVAETKFVSGTGSPLFEADHLKCGIEICGDFNEGNLAKATGPATLDFEFMMSGSNYHMFGKSDMDKIPVRNGGYFLHVDQAPAKAAFYNGVWCVARGSGWHGVNLDRLGGIGTDPWTGTPIKQDRYGVSRAVGHVISLSNKPTNNLTSGRAFPGRRAYSGLRLVPQTSVSRPLDSATGFYEVTLVVELSPDKGSTSERTNRTVAFKVKNGHIVRSSAATDAAGKSTAVFRCHRDQPATLTASFHGAKLETVASFEWIGPGEVTKISTLKGTPHSEVSTYSTPI